MPSQSRQRGRPPATSRQAIESVAVDLFLRQGYSQTTIGDIAQAAGVSKTSFFRYFDSKSEIVWAEFDAHTMRLRERLQSALDDADSLVIVRAAVVATLRADLDPQGLSLRRFRLFDSSKELRSQESEHWISWADSVAAYIARRHGLREGSALPAAVGGAVQAAMLATLRDWADRTVDPEGILRDLDTALEPICAALQPLLSAKE